MTKNTVIIIALVLWLVTGVLVAATYFANVNLVHKKTWETYVGAKAGESQATKEAAGAAAERAFWIRNLWGGAAVVGFTLTAGTMIFAVFTDNDEYEY